MSRRRVLQVVYSLNAGGTETWLAELTERIDWSRFQLDFCIVGRAGEGHYADAVRQRGATIWSCRLTRAWWRFKRMFEAALRESSYDVVHAFIDPGVVLRAAARAGVPVRIAHYRSTTPRQSNGVAYRMYDRWQGRLARRHATALLGVSEAVMAACVGEDWRRDRRAAVVPGSVDVGGIRAAATPDPAHIREALRIPAQAPVVGNVGRLVTAKNQTEWLDAASEIRTRLPECRFVIVGDGERRAALEKHARNIGLGDRVIFTGFRTDVADLLGAFDVLLQTSAWEGMPRAVLEAMAADVPVVASDIAPHCEVLPMRESIYTGGAADAAGKVADVLADAALRSRLVEAQRSVIEHYDWPIVLGALERIYDGESPSSATNRATGNAEVMPCRT